MPGIARLGDLCTGHDVYPPRPNLAGSATVFVNGRPLHRVGDAWLVHSGPNPFTNPPHAGVTFSGSHSVFCDGRAVARINDPVSAPCASRIAQGSANVFCND